MEGGGKEKVLADINMKNRPEYLNEVERFMETVKTVELKELFIRLRRKHPEIKSMRTMKEDIQNHLDSITVNQKDVIVNKALFTEDLLGILIAN